MQRPRYLPDDFTLVLIGVVTLASLFPAQGAVAQAFEWITTAAIALLFSCMAPNSPAPTW